MHHFVLRLLATVVCSLALPAYAASTPIDSIYTPLEGSSCKPIEENAKEGWAKGRCDGIAGYKLDWMEGDLRQSLNVIAPDGKEFPLELWSTVSSGFSALGDKAEWRVQKAGKKTTPIALIVRFNVSENPDQPEKTTSYLTVSKITANEICVTDVVKPGANANQQARDLADAATDKPCMKTGAEENAALSLEQIRAKVGPLDVFHPADGDLPSFDELVKLTADVKAAAASATDPELKGELEMAHLRALQMTLATLPPEPDKATAEPYASWLRTQSDRVFQDEISGSWLVPVSQYWALADKYRGAAVGDAIAFQAVNAPMGGECEGLMSCNSTASLRAEGEYLKRFPTGKFVEMALSLVNDNMNTMLADWDSQPEEQAETQKTLAEWEALLAPVADSDITKQVRSKLSKLQQKPVAASTTPTQSN